MADSKRSVNRAALIMFVYAILLLALSLLAYVMAPPGANAATAIVVGSVSAVVMSAMAVMSLLIERNRKLGMIGIHVGMLLPLVFAAVFYSRIEAAHRSSGVHRYFEQAFQDKVDNGARQQSEQDRTAFYVDAQDSLSGERIPETDKAYLGRTLTLLFGASTAAFVLLILSRPDVSASKDTAFAADPDSRRESAAKPEDFA